MGKNKTFWISLAGVLIITAIVYYPSLYHILKGETYCYFLDTQGDNTAWSLIKNWWNYESVRQIAPGDRLLFRPLLFVTLGLEKAYFGGYYFYWRIASLVMHLFVVTCLFRLLWKFKPGILATLMTIFFGTTYLCLNTLLYEQIASYALFTGFLLISFFYVYQGTEGGRTRDLVIAAISMAIACFLHETGIIFTTLFIGYFWWRRKHINWKPWAWSFFAILILWSAVYFPSKFIHPVRFLDSELNNLLSWKTFVVGIKGSLVLLTRWGQQAFMPAYSIINPMTVWWSYPVDIQFGISWGVAFIVNCIGIMVMVATYLWTKTKEVGMKCRNSFIVLILMGLSMFLIANSLFRTNSHGGNYLVDHNFNLYIWAALLVLLIYILVSLQKLTKKYTYMVMLGILIFIGLNAPTVFRMNYEIMKMQTETRDYFGVIDDFIDEHPEDDMTFKILTTTLMQENLELTYWKVPEDIDNNFPTLETLPDYTQIESSIPAIIYEKYWSENPEYTLIYHPNNKSLEVVNE